MIAIDGIATLVNTVVSRIWPDKSEEQKLQFQIALKQVMMESELATGQLTVNAKEAENGNIFVSGWRPGVAWVLAASFAWTYFFTPALTFAFAASGHPVPELPQLNTGELMPMLFGLLGLGAFRSFERIKGVIPKGR